MHKKSQKHSTIVLKFVLFYIIIYNNMCYQKIMIMEASVCRETVYLLTLFIR